MGGKTGNKAGYFDKLKGLLETYASVFIVTVDNVSSQQMHEIRQSLRGEGVVLMGKNTMVSLGSWFPLIFIFIFIFDLVRLPQWRARVTGFWPPWADKTRSAER